MKHQLGRKKMGRNSSHRRATLRNMATEVLRHERITTTLGKARVLRSYVERLITVGKGDDLHARRRVAAVVQDRDVVKKMFTSIVPRMKDRPGGYTRILKLGTRRGDNAPMAIIELVDAATQHDATTQAEAAA